MNIVKEGLLSGLLGYKNPSQDPVKPLCPTYVQVASDSSTSRFISPEVKATVEQVSAKLGPARKCQHSRGRYFSKRDHGICFFFFSRGYLSVLLELAIKFCFTVLDLYIKFPALGPITIWSCVFKAVAVFWEAVKPFFAGT